LKLIELDEWTKEDKVMFEQAYQFHGKCFHRIRQMVKTTKRNNIESENIIKLNYFLSPPLVARQVNCKLSQILLFLEEGSHTLQHGASRKEKA
jgi:hypothetical protein